MRYFLFLLAANFPGLLLAQRWHVTAFGGIANYQGDLQEKRITTNQSHGAFAVGLQYDFTPHLSAKAGFAYAKVTGDDKQNKDPLLVARNLNFASQILEGNLLAEYRFFDLDKKRFTPYVFAGLGVFGFDPYTRDTLGQKFYLQPYTTEGKSYSRVQLSLPFGAGIKLRVNDRMTLGYEIGMRVTSTDYLDDLSTVYVDRDQLLAAKGPKAVELAYRGGELKDGNPAYPEAGTIRGRPDAKDWYYLQGITLTYRLDKFLSGSRSGREGNGRQLDCPKGVY
jgi:opacity protein-like surface antigen